MGEMVTIQANGQSTQGYLAVPESGKGAGVVVLQEWWGLVPHIKEVVDRFAAAGYVALAPDLYHGETTTSPDRAGKLMMSLRIDEAEKEMRAAIEYLLAHSAVEPKRIGTVGFCMGGLLSLYAACKNPQVNACVIFYGGFPGVEPDLASLQAPVLGLYAERDGFVTVDSVRQLEAKLNQLGKSAEIKIYEGCDHAFFNDHRPEVYNKEAAEDAWRRVLDFYAKHLS
ncbi:MAG: dienelactone hydrolase family protein [Acidobacteriota bacterium]|nr:dienelactone hydrolase family protein [Blastocatellia bacterium]MDW8412298.1 dienelactone hydrolase family protein [Acidobacteriota bacterium]